MSLFSHCGQCGRKLRDCIFCPQCNHSLCCLPCFNKHQVSHRIGLPPLLRAVNKRQGRVPASIMVRRKLPTVAREARSSPACPEN